MNKKIYSYSDSLVLSLCKEIEFIKNRSKNINHSLKSCQNKILSRRLSLELNKLNKNRLEIINISEDLFKINCENLSFQFLLELSRRSTTFQQI